ncbi:MAG: hypothetical protein KDK70_03925 [Myxococcales bacterium]|nr:hypothetical protein [Myxococcales bacterium]
MPAGLVVLATLVAAFVVVHLGLSHFRAPVVARLGEVRFTVVQALLAWAGLGAMIAAYVACRDQSPPGLGLGAVAGAREGAAVAMGLGLVLIVSIVGPRGYLDSAAVVFGSHTRAPRGMERITRHPFLVGLALLSAGHLVVAPRLAGVIVFGGLLLMAVIGGPLQDRKLRAQRGAPHVAYLEATSIVPGVALLRGRQTLVLRELPWPSLVLGVAMIAGARALHGTAAAPWLVMGVLVLGPSWFALASAFRHHRARSA